MSERSMLSQQSNDTYPAQHAVAGPSTSECVQSSELNWKKHQDTPMHDVLLTWPTGGVSFLPINECVIWVQNSMCVLCLLCL